MNTKQIFDELDPTGELFSVFNGVMQSLNESERQVRNRLKHTDSPVDWRTHPRFFRCHCPMCILVSGLLTKKWGKAWQARYGESNIDFRLRYLTWHQPEKM